MALPTVDASHLATVGPVDPAATPLVLAAVRDAAEARVAALEAGSGTTGVQKRTVTLTQAADLAALGAGVKTKTKSLGAVLPAGARFLGVSLESLTGFDDGAAATYALNVGYAGAGEIVAAESVAAAASGFPKAGTAGAQGYAGAALTAGQATVKLTSNADLNTATAGAITVTIFFAVP